VTGQRILAVDDDPQILRAMRASLEARGFDVVTASSGEGALDTASNQPVDLMLLDLGLPGISGDEVIERLRSWSQLPVIVLSIRDAQEDKVRALEVGADDYVTKPFDIPELLARIRAVLRRASGEELPVVLDFEGLRIDLARELVTRGDEPIHLTRTEYALLREMATHPGKLLTHKSLLQRVWGPAYGDESHYLRVFVRQLRKKLGDDPARPRWITTEPGLGYRWVAGAGSGRVGDPSQ
jgi:two-component system KDP operon response regulator KdpE